MKKFKKPVGLAILIFMVPFLLALPVFATSHESEKPDMEEVKKEMSEFIETVKGYSVGQKDEALKDIKVTMDALDVKIDTLENRLAQKWDKMDQESREQARKYMAELRRQRQELSEWYGGMKYSTLQAWEEVKKGFVDSYYRLGVAFEKAGSEF